MRITESEDRLQTDSKRYLDVALPADAIAWHTPNGGHRSKAVAGKMKAFGVLSGVPDWIILWQGRVLFLELKTKRGSLTPSQRVFRDAVKGQGFQHHVCRSLLEIELALGVFGIETKARLAA